MFNIIKIQIVILFSLSVLLSCGTTNVSSYFKSHSYIVQKGDTLTTIAFRYQIEVPELLKLNHLSANSNLKPGQTITVKIPYDEDVVSTTTTKANPQAQVHIVQKGDTLTNIASRYQRQVPELLSLNNLTKKSILKLGQTIIVKPGKASTYKFKTTKKWTTKTTRITKKYYKNNKNWSWPTPASYDVSSSQDVLKGLSFIGKTGENIKATAEGTVIYSGNGLKQYGNLVIVKHTNNLLSAYAFNLKNLVKEKDKVTQGEILATMGSKNKKGHLYFEIRKNGKPTNPLYYLKPRK